MPQANAEATITRFLLSSYLTADRLRMPEAATVPNNTIPAPPRTGIGIAATTCPSHGTSPRTTIIPPPAVTTHLDLTPVSATSPTFCAKADRVNDPKIGASAE